MSDENGLSQKAATLTVPLALHQILTGRRRVHCDAGGGDYGVHPQRCRKWGDIMSVTYSQGIWLFEESNRHGGEDF